MMNRATGMAAATAAVLMLVGCVPSADEDRTVEKTRPGLTIGEAKRVAQGVEDAIVAKLPETMVSSVEQRATGILLPCDADRGYQWTGRTVVTLTESTSPESVIDEVLTAYGDDDEFRPRDITDSVGPAVQLLGPYGSGYIVGRRAANAVDVASFSPCFVLPEGSSPSIEY